MDDILEKRLKECAEESERTGDDHREVALRRISEWRDVLRAVSDDYKGLNEDEYFQLTEKEIDSWERENR